jgi:hypothetical protein
MFVANVHMIFQCETILSPLHAVWVAEELREYLSTVDCLVTTYRVP